jgi:plasmid stabilization system protein ParE
MFYESRRVGLGKSFVAEVERTIALIRLHPDMGVPGPLRQRRMPLLGFPYSLVYRHEPESIWILAVAHQSRRPGYWRHRK